ncbi:hypothetical protein IKE67_02295 [bacterium]|nr:hypothetical protein [bacterium]
MHKLLYDYFPGAGAIRAVGRYLNILCPIFAILLANFIEKINKKALKAIIIITIIIEQIPVHSFLLYSKKQALQDITKYNVPKTCSVIFMNYSKIPDENHTLIHKIEVDGMWLALAHRIYTVNGYGGMIVNRPRVKLKPECIIELKD